MPIAFVLVILISALLILHSYIYRGLRITLNFFILSFLWASLHTEKIIKSFHMHLERDTSPLFIFSSTMLFILVMGSAITLYLSWCISERILNRFTFFNKKLFPTLLLSILSAVFISPYFTTGIMTIDINLWQQPFKFSEFFNFFVSKILSIEEYNFFISRFWFFMINIFLIAWGAFFLIECSRYKIVHWKSLFALIAFVHLWITRALPHSIIPIVDFAIFGALFLLAIFYPLPLEFGWVNYKNNEHLKGKLWFKYFLSIAPLLILFIIVFIVGFDAVIVRKWLLIFSIIPLILLVLLSIRSFPFVFILTFALIFSIFFREKSIFITMPVFTFLLFQILDGLIKRNMGFRLTSKK